MSDDPGMEMLKAAAQGTAAAALEPFGRLIEAIAGPLVSQLQFRRIKAEVRLFQRTQDLLDREGIPASRVDWKTLVPLLGGNELEDEEDVVMHDRWATLLANAASGDLGSTVLPVFPRILGELSPLEASVLDAIYNDQERIYYDAGTPNPRAFLNLASRFAIDRGRLSVLIEHLAQLDD